MAVLCHQAITWTTIDVCSIGPLGTNVNKIRTKHKLSYHENVLEYVVREMASFLSRGMSQSIFCSIVAAQICWIR